MPAVSTDIEYFRGSPISRAKHQSIRGSAPTDRNFYGQPQPPLLGSGFLIETLRPRSPQNPGFPDCVPPFCGIPSRKGKDFSKDAGGKVPNPGVALSRPSEVWRGRAVPGGLRKTSVILCRNVFTLLSL